MKKYLMAFLMILPVLVWAQIAGEEPVPMSDIFNDIAELVKNFKGMTGIGIASAILTILVQILKQPFMGSMLDKANPFLKRILITVLGQIAGIVIAINGGLGWVEAVIAGLLTSGGAVAIWEAIKPFLQKKDESK